MLVRVEALGFELLAVRRRGRSTGPGGVSAMVISPQGCTAARILPTVGTGGGCVRQNPQLTDDERNDRHLRDSPVMSPGPPTTFRPPPVSEF